MYRQQPPRMLVRNHHAVGIMNDYSLKVGLGPEAGGIADHYQTAQTFNSSLLAAPHRYSEVRTNSNSRVTVADNVGFTVSPCILFWLMLKAACCALVHW
jgi:hypothetical protein